MTIMFFFKQKTAVEMRISDWSSDVCSSDLPGIEPGATIGILGGGQLGRMLAIAASQLGYRSHIFAPEDVLPAADVSAQVTRADYGDLDALRRFAREVDVVTYEFENIETAPIASLAQWVTVRPSVRALEVAQDRLAEKDFVAGLGGRPAAYHGVANRAELDTALDAIGTPAVLTKIRRAHVCTPVTNAHLVCRPLLEKNKHRLLI